MLHWHRFWHLKFEEKKLNKFVKEKEKMKNISIKYPHVHIMQQPLSTGTVTPMSSRYSSIGTL